MTRAELYLSRAIVVVLGPVIVPLAFVVSFTRHTAQALRYAWLDARCEIEDMRDCWGSWRHRSWRR